MRRIKQRGATINPGNLQEMLDSTPSALAQGQRQWLTPAEYAQAFCIPFSGLLADTACDLQMGQGDLLNATLTENKIGIEIDVDCAKKPRGAKGKWHICNADVTKFSDKLDEAKFRCDQFVLNPPFSLKWPKDVLSYLAASDVAAVRHAFQAAPGKFLDSTQATLMMALHFCTVRGEGFMVCNEDTAIRLLGEPDKAATSPLRNHVWLWLSIPGTIFPGTDPSLKVAVLYFARDHNQPMPRHAATRGSGHEEIAQLLTIEQQGRWRYRGGVSVKEKSYAELMQSVDPFDYAKDEWKILHSDKPDHNIWLSAHGTIRCYLTPFQRISGRIPTDLVKKLRSLDGQFPSSLVVQKMNREALLSAVNSNIWRVDPKLPEVVTEAIAAYNRVRAPFYPLSEIQRIGYLDESDHIECRREGLADFAAGKRYRLQSKTVPIGRHAERANYSGGTDDIEITGEDLLITILDEHGTEHRFMHKPDMVLHKKGVVPEKPLEEENLYDLSTLSQFFSIPDVPDIASLRPQDYQAAIDALSFIEAQCNALAGVSFHFRNFQKDDLARAVLHDGCILSWHAGLGKTIAAYAYPKMKGSKVNLIVAPDSLHLQIQKEGREKFGVNVKALMSQADFYQDAELQALAVKRLTHRSRTYPSLKAEAVTRIEAFLSEPTRERWVGDGCSVGGTGIRGIVIRKPEPRMFEGTEYCQTFCEPTSLWQVMVALKLCPAEDPGTDKEGFVPNVADVITAMRHVGALQDHQPEPYDGKEIWRITSYTALGLNGADQWVPETTGDGVEIVNLVREQSRKKIEGWEERFADGIGNEANGIRCVLAPTLARLVGDLFECVVVDEGVRMKSTDAYQAEGVRDMRPRYRLVLTATPIKNRLEDIFWLAHWACGGNAQPTARFPYENSNEARERFANEHQLMERNLTKEANARAERRPARFVKRTAEICNIHRLWKLLGPIVIRRRKDDTGQDIVPKIIIPLRVKPGTAQQATYKFHLDHPPEQRKDGEPMKPVARVVTHLNLLRQAAICPHDPEMRKYHDPVNASAAASWSPFTTKIAAAMSLIVERLTLGEQMILMSPYQEASEVIYGMLKEAGVSVCLLDGNTSPKSRAKLAAQFKQQKFAVMVAGQKAMGEGHSFECCPNLIRMSLDWAFDINDQCGDRVHRLTSKFAVRIWDLITENTVDEKLHGLYMEKGDSSNLALDGRLFADTTEEVNLAQLLRDAVSSFDPTAETVDEQTLEDEWPKLSAKLRAAETRYREFHPPIIEVAANKGQSQVGLADLNAALAALSAPAATNRNNSKRQRTGFIGSADDALADLLASLDPEEAPSTDDLRKRINERRK